jgi:hypothetical protein
MGPVLQPMMPQLVRDCDKMRVVTHQKKFENTAKKLSLNLIIIIITMILN